MVLKKNIKFQILFKSSRYLLLNNETKTNKQMDTKNLEKYIDLMEKRDKKKLNTALTSIFIGVLFKIMMMIGLIFLCYKVTVWNYNTYKNIQQIERYIKLEEQSNWVKAQIKLNKQKWAKERLLQADSLDSDTSLYMK